MSELRKSGRERGSAMRCNMLRLGGVGVGAMAIALAAPAQSPVPGWLACEYTLTVIEPPDLGPGSETLEFNDINDHFVAVGRLGLGSPGNVPCLWSEEQGVVILPSPPGFGGGTAWRINNNGWILVRAGGGPVFSFVYIPQGDGTYEIVTLPPQYVTGSIFAMDINDHNEVVGRFQFLPRGATALRWAGFRWSPNGKGLQWYQVPGWSATECFGINNEGVIVGSVGPNNSANPGAAGVRMFVDTGGDVVIVEPAEPWLGSFGAQISNSGVRYGGVITVPGGSGSWRLPSIVQPGDDVAWSVEPPAGWPTWGITSRFRDDGVSGGAAYTLSTVPTQTKPLLYVDGQHVWLSDVLDSPFPLLGFVSVVGSEGSIFMGFNGKVLMFRPALGAADMNCDGLVDSADLSILLEHWNTPAPAADLNGDGIVDGADLGILLNAWSPR